MAITPNPFLIADYDTQELTSTVANAIWEITSGTGALSAGSNVYTKVYTPSADGSVAIKARESSWDSLDATHFDLQADDSLINKNTATAYAYTKFFLKTIGDYINTKFPSLPQVNSRIRILVPNTGTSGADIVVQTNGILDAYGNVYWSGTVNAEDTVRIEIYADKQIRFTIAGTIRYTTPTLSGYPDSRGFQIGILSIGEAVGNKFFPITGIASSMPTVETVTGTVSTPVIGSTFTFDELVRPFHHSDPDDDFEAITRSHEYEDGSKSFNELNTVAPREWNLVYYGLSPGQARVFDTHFAIYKFSNSFTFVDKFGNTNTNVYYKSYKKSHDGHKSWVKQREITFIQYPT